MTDFYVGGVSTGDYSDYINGCSNAPQASLMWWLILVLVYKSARLAQLKVVPELMIYKGRNKVNYWRVYSGS
jgi:hypothetical protein